MLDKFLRYISVDTQSDDTNSNCPSSPGQLDLAKILVDELKEMGIDDAHMDENGYVYASIEGTVKDAPKVGLISHMDTALEITGAGVNPQIVEKYEGGDIILNDKYKLTEEDFPFLKELKGHKLVTTDGTTLLGADDKAGLAIIMSIAEFFVNNRDLEFGDIKIGFTPDEEIGRGASLFDIEKFGADFAYTIDGGPVAELEYENFNAASAKIHIEGKPVHPGSAKNVLVNALLIASELNEMLPANERPEHTEGYEGFYMLQSIDGTAAEADMEYIIRDFFKDGFQAKKDLLTNAVDFLNKKYGDRIKLEITDSYYNMREKVEPHIEIVDLAKKAIEEVGLTPIVKPIRGGTDGATLSHMGLPTPNLFTGGYNFHGRYEILSVDIMEKSFNVIKNIIINNAKENK
ncbi:peptidase T [uncultured Anaerococcus sp.]|uniref:peptidase T n=1 Tax=uncultured Anaerococcus sp. TaxID=293428 RepID=UPI00280C0FA6|nr:peptidase T [uncultured Anaerococcus sp.]MDU5149744.1 peptidase T [Anaerococcus prevotii]